MFVIGLTDHEMFSFWRDLQFALPEVNYWTPTPWRIRGLREGDHFYFLLKAPIRKIGGFGEFVRYEELRCSEAWARFGPGNGVADQLTLRNRAMGYVSRNTSRDTSIPDPVIGCIILRNLTILPEDMFFAPEDRGAPVGAKVMRYKKFPGLDTLLVPIELGTPTAQFELVNPNAKQDRKLLTVVRPGQQAFRKAIFDAYEGACAITGERISATLDAAHIQRYINSNSHDVRNGLLLRKDIHALFDAGLLTIGQDMRVAHSTRISDSTYAELEGALIRLPRQSSKFRHSSNRRVAKL